MFDDTVLHKEHSHHIPLVPGQYSGNVAGSTKGMGVVNWGYYNAQTHQFWLIDYRSGNNWNTNRFISTPSPKNPLKQIEKTGKK